MMQHTLWVLGLLIGNAVVTGIYLFVQFVVMPPYRKIWKQSEKNDRRKCLITALVMLLCPVVGPMFFGLGYVYNVLFFRKTVDLEDVIFSKDKVGSYHRGDEERERNIVPLEEALAVSDKQSLRTLMLDILKGDISESLHSIAEALNSKDSETAHYAASALRDEINQFRGNVQRLFNAMEAGGEDALSCAHTLLEYMNAFLSQHVFTNMEQQSYVEMMDEVASYIFRRDETQMESRYYEWISMRSLEMEDYETCEKWCLYAKRQYPKELSSYTCLLKLYFAKHDKEKFFQVMNELKSSTVVIDRETLEMIRTFS